MDAVEQAFMKNPRKNFLPDEAAADAGVDVPLPIGFGQTNSQPATVRMMLEWLELEPGNKVLDVGSGSGWTTALLAYLVGSRGKVYAVERVPELVELGRSNCREAGTKNTVFYKAGKKYGLPQFAPYDRILVSAAASTIPEDLLDQLKDGGKMVIPVGSDVLEIVKESDENYDISAHAGFAFVPLV